MSNFVFVIPLGWTGLDWTNITNNIPDMTHSNVTDWVRTNSYFIIEEILKNNNIIPQTSSLIEAVLFNDEVFAVRLG